MHTKFQVAVFRNKRDIRHLICLFSQGHLPDQMTLWFFASDGSEIQAREEYI